MPSEGTFSIGTATGRDYSTIGGWEADTDVSLTGNVTGECYNDSEFDETVSIDGSSNLSASQFRTLTVAGGERHDGTAGTGARINYSSPTGGDIIIESRETFGEVSWLEVTAASATLTNATVKCIEVVLADNDVTLGNLIVRDLNLTNDGTGSAVNTGISLDFNAGTVTVHNTVVYDMVGTNSSTGDHFNKGIRLVDTNAENPTYNIHNCTVQNITSDAGTQRGLDEASMGNSAVYNIKNCVVMDADDTDFRWGDTSGTLDVQNCASSDATADDQGGTGHLINQTASNWFVSLTDGSEDYHLQSTANGVDAGVDLGDVPAKYDIDGRDRHFEVVTWDIGVDEEELVARPFRVVTASTRAVVSAGRSITRT